VTNVNLVDAVNLWEPEPGWLNTASYGIPPRPGVEALQRSLEEWRHGANGWDKWDASTDRARSAFARLVSAPSRDITVGTAVSQILAPVAARTRLMSGESQRADVAGGEPPRVEADVVLCRPRSWSTGPSLSWAGLSRRSRT
jgi:hypothetical protein